MGFKELSVHDNRSFLTYEFEEQDKLDEKTFFTIADAKIPALLRFDYFGTIEPRYLSFETTGLSPVADLFTGVLGIKSFLLNLNSLLNSIALIKNNDIIESSLIYHPQYIYIKENLNELFMIGLPLNNELAKRESVFDFVKKIIFGAKFDANEDCSCISTIIKYIGGEDKSVEGLKEQIDNVIADIEAMEASIKKCIKCNAKIRHGAKFCAVCGTPIEEDNIDDSESHYGETTLLGLQEYGATTVLSRDMESISFPYIIRNKNNECIEIDTMEFTVGKDKNKCDYAISNNTAISRIHMQIIFANGNYYAVDLNSTNHTFINDEMLINGNKTVIKNGDRIRLADEEFVFHT